MQDTPKRSLRGVLPSIVCTMLLTVSLFGCGGGGDSQGRIVGTVYDGDPALETRTSSGVKVYVVRSEASNTVAPSLVVIAESVSDQAGRFTISVPPGEYSIYAANGYGFFGSTRMLCTIFGNPTVRSGQNSTVALGYNACSGAVP